jgi:hypothetical protein
MRYCSILAALTGLLFVAAALSFDTKPWLDDLTQVKQVLSAKYANLEWAVFEREANLPKLFAETKDRIEKSHTEAEARAAFDRLARKIGDEHLLFDWPRGASGSSGSVDPCADYDARSQGLPLAALMPGYRELKTAQSSTFPAGLIAVNGTELGVIKIGVFMPQGYPELCRALVAKTPPATPCDESCQDGLAAEVSNMMTRELAVQLRALRTAGAKVLMVDIAGNGGGTEWAEAAARMFSSVRLASAPVFFARGEHWATQFTDIGHNLRRYAKTASGTDRKMLLDLAVQADAKRIVAQDSCDSAPLWRGEHPACQWLGQGFYASGLLASADPKALRGKPWANLWFSPMQYPYEEGVWQGPLIVLVDRDVSSAASQFTALLQDNKAALVLGEPTGGGCGHTNGGTPTTLTNSKARLLVPDCVRLRPDGANEVMGVMPDTLVGFAAADGPHRRAQRVLARLPEAVTEVKKSTR